MPPAATSVLHSARGTLILVVGPSGVGKDSLIAYCRAQLVATDRIVFPRRFITRPEDSVGEDHMPLSEVEFRSHADQGSFALHWLAHGLGYGIPAAIAEDLRQGRHVLVNASRSVVDHARKTFCPVLIISVTAPARLLADRLRLRGRETAERIDHRLGRADSYVVAGPDVVTVDNSGTIEQAGGVLLGVLRSL